MKLNKYFYTTTITYLVIFLAPAISQIISLTPNQLITLTTAVYLVGAIALILIATQLKERPLLERSSETQTVSHILLWGIGGIILAFFAQTFSAIIESQLFNMELGSENTQTILTVIKEFPLYLGAVTIGGPIMEELVFRRSLIGVLTQKISPLLASIISSFAFAIIHNDGHLLIYFMMGMTFYFIYQKSGSIWSSIIAHCGMNLFVVVIQLL